MEGSLKELAKYRLIRAKEMLAASESNLEIGQYRTSLNRSYYAIFHAMRSANALKKFDSSKHSGVIAFFTKEYLKTEILDRNLAVVIKDSSFYREKSDYDDFYVAGQTEAVEQFKNAKYFIHKIEEYVNLVSEKITLCGDNCIECPRYNAHSEAELRAVAELWYKVGWRDRIVSNEEIQCTGCSSHKDCTYQLVECTKKHNVKKCNQCTLFPCDKISNMLKRSEEYQKKCKELCSADEYLMLKRAFFDKEKNLKK